MALQIPHAGLQLEEDFSDANAHLPTQAFIIDLDDAVIDGMVEAASRGQEIRLSLGNKPTFSYGTASHRIEPAFEDETDDIELFTNPPHSSRAERLPQLAMSLFRKPELGYTYPYYKNSDEEDEEEGEYETASSPEADDSDLPAQSDVGLDTDIAALRDSMKQREDEKHEKSARVIEGSAHATTKPIPAKRGASSLQKALSGRRSPFGRTSLSPSPALSAVGSPSLAPADASSQQATEKARHSRSPIIHELAFKEQSYDNLWNKYPGSSETEFRNALDKVADHDTETNNYVLRKKYWRELDVWRHDYASDEERQRAVENAIRQFDKMRLSTAEPEWEKLLPFAERGQGKILSKVQVSIAKGTVAPIAPKIRVQKPDDHADSNNDSGENGSSSNRTDDESEHTLSPTRKGPLAKKKMTQREIQEKRLLSTKKKSTPTSAPSAASSTKVSPVKSAAARASAAAPQGKFKSKEFVSESDTDGESEATPVQHKSVPMAKSASSSSAAKIAAANKGVPASIIKERIAQKEREAKEAKEKEAREAREARETKERETRERDERATPPAVRKAAKPSPVKEARPATTAAKALPKKRSRDSEDDDDSSSGSSSGPMMKRLKAVKPAVRPPTNLRAREEREREERERDVREWERGRDSRDRERDRERERERDSRDQPAARLPPPQRPRATASPSSSGSSSKLKLSRDRERERERERERLKSPLASSANASDLSSEESVPPIGTRKRYAVTKPSTKRSLPDDLVAKAQRFKTLYEKYAALYKDIASRSSPPKERVADLLKMHRKLEALKKDINEEVTMCG